MKLSYIITLGTAAIAQQSSFLTAVHAAPSGVAHAIENFNSVLDDASSGATSTNAAVKGSEMVYLRKRGDDNKTTNKGSDNNKGGGSDWKKRSRPKSHSRRNKKTKKTSSSRSNNKKRKNSSSSRSSKARKNSRNYNYSRNMCGRYMKRSDRRLCDQLEYQFCDTSRDQRQNRNFCNWLGFTSNYDDALDDEAAAAAAAFISEEEM